MTAEVQCADEKRRSAKQLGAGWKGTARQEDGLSISSPRQLTSLRGRSEFLRWDRGRRLETELLPHQSHDARFSHLAHNSQAYPVKGETPVSDR